MLFFPCILIIFYVMSSWPIKMGYRHLNFLLYIFACICVWEGVYFLREYFESTFWGFLIILWLIEQISSLYKGLASHIYEADKLRWIPNATFRRDKNQLLYKDLYYFWNQSLYRLHCLYNSFQREKMKINLFIFSLYV